MASEAKLRRSLMRRGEEDKLEVEREPEVGVVSGKLFFVVVVGAQMGGKGIGEGPTETTSGGAGQSPLRDFGPGTVGKTVRLRWPRGPAISWPR